MPESSPNQSPRNLVADLITAIFFVGSLGIVSIWFEIRKNRNDFYPTDWLLLAPLELEGGEEVARNTDLLANDGGEGKFTASPSKIHKLPSNQALIWTQYTAPQGEIPFVILRNIVGEKITNAVAYAQTTISMPEAKEIQMGVAADDGVKIWLNGNVVFNRGPIGGYAKDKDLLTVKLLAGDNQILVKNTQLEGGWGFALHFFDK